MIDKGKLNSFDSPPYYNGISHEDHCNIEKQLLKFKDLSGSFRFAFETDTACQDLTDWPLDFCLACDQQELDICTAFPLSSYVVSTLVKFLHLASIL